MKNYTRKKRLTNKKRPRRSYKSGKSIKKKRGGGILSLFKKGDKKEYPADSKLSDSKLFSVAPADSKLSDSKLFSVAPAVVEEQGNRHSEAEKEKDKEKNKKRYVHASETHEPLTNRISSAFSEIPGKVVNAIKNPFNHRLKLGIRSSIKKF